MASEQEITSEAQAERSPEIIEEEFKLMMGDRPWTGYCHIKVNEEEGFSITDYFESRFSLGHPHLVVRHRYGKSEQSHFHIQGFLKEGITRKDVHSTYEAHPAKRRCGKGSKPFKMRKDHFDQADAIGFLYMVKPQEALPTRPHEDLVIFCGFKHNEVPLLIAWSAELSAMKKRTVQHMISLMEVNDATEPKDFHLKATRLVLDSLKAEGKQFHNGIRHQILTAMYERDTSLCEYVIQKYL
jgi:hypothetical protein